MFNPKNPTHMTLMKYRPAHTCAMPHSAFSHGFFSRDIANFLGSDDLPNATPRVNIVDRANDFKLDLAAPGYGKEDLKLDVQGDTLTISAEKKLEELKEGERFTRREFSRTQFTRSFRLPELVNIDGITAEHRNGVLTVIMPKSVVAKPHTREVIIG